MDKFIAESLRFEFNCRECQAIRAHRFVLVGPDRILVQCLVCADTQCVFEAPTPPVPPFDKEHEHRPNHPTVPLRVVVDIDEGIAPIVERLNAIPGVRTFASCQGGVSYGPYVMVGWDNAETLGQLQKDFVMSGIDDGLCFGYVHQARGEAPAEGENTVHDVKGVMPSDADADSSDGPLSATAGEQHPLTNTAPAAGDTLTPICPRCGLDVGSDTLKALPSGEGRKNGPYLETGKIW